MKNNIDRETKELDVNLPKPQRKTKPKENEPDNSFYERQSEKKSTTWTEDWRAKTLAISLVTIVFLGLGIPGGMAITGFFNHKNEPDYIKESEKYGLAEDLINIWTDEAILNHYASMVYEGYISQNKYKVDMENAEKKALDTIKDEKSDIKSTYGNKWEDAWDDSLQTKGFHSTSNGGEEEYKNSIIANDILTKEIAKYSTYNVFTTEVGIDDVARYKSSENNKNQYLIIDNTKVFNEEDKTGETITIDDSPITIEDTSFTSEDLISLYIQTFEPVVYNKSRISFSLSDESGAASLDAVSITITGDDLDNALAFYKAIPSGDEDFKPAAEIFSGIQSQHNLSFGTSDSGSGETESYEEGVTTTATIDSVAIGMSEADKNLNPITVTPTPLKSLLEAAFDGAINIAIEKNILPSQTTINNLTSRDIDRMGQNSDVTEAFGLSLYTDLSAEGMPLAYDGSREYYYNYKMDNSGNIYTGYVSTNGLNIVNVQLKDSTLIIEQLNYDNNSDGSIVNYSVFDSYTNWLSTNFEKILLWDYMFTPNDKGWFDENNKINKGDITLDEFFLVNRSFELGESQKILSEDEQIIGQALIATTTKSTRKNVINNYVSTEDFIKKNEDIFNYDTFRNDQGKIYFDWLTSSNVYSFYMDVIDTNNEQWMTKRKDE